MGRGRFRLLQSCLSVAVPDRVWACSPLIQASAAPAVASSVAISAHAVLPLLSPPACVTPPAAATWWWAPPTPAARAATGARRLQPLPAHITGLDLCPAWTSRTWIAPPAAPRVARAGPARTSHQMCHDACPPYPLPLCATPKRPEPGKLGQHLGLFLSPFSVVSLFS